MEPSDDECLQHEYRSTHSNRCVACPTVCSPAFAHIPCQRGCRLDARPLLNKHFDDARITASVVVPVSVGTNGADAYVVVAEEGTEDSYRVPRIKVFKARHGYIEEEPVVNRAVECTSVTAMCASTDQNTIALSLNIPNDRVMHATSALLLVTLDELLRMPEANISSADAFSVLGNHVPGEQHVTDLAALCNGELVVVTDRQHVQYTNMPPTELFESHIGFQDNPIDIEELARNHGVLGDATNRHFQATVALPGGGALLIDRRVEAPDTIINKCWHLANEKEDAWTSVDVLSTVDICTLCALQDGNILAGTADCRVGIFDYIQGTFTDTFDSSVLRSMLASLDMIKSLPSGHVLCIGSSHNPDQVTAAIVLEGFGSSVDVRNQRKQLRDNEQARIEALSVPQDIATHLNPLMLRT